MALKIVQTGFWLYDGDVETPVDIVALNSDWWYELAKANGQLDEGELPKDSDSDGFLYYARFRNAGHLEEPTLVDSLGHTTSAEAMEAAQEKVVGPITWIDLTDV